ncbi:helix-turn-helix domain-containing protein [Streptomyces actinomycinicus]|uniref:Helix-turn-helix domain-containing protein n=1 Tax=Streptomyces actinomycinicus TaxID=1695166 RepID=A0A937EQB4_9ACTN|nr:helix-turn-helix transcriptional regulator [Streptomyces actinomycinicus]MBL1087607.1 helix-turn-helix domain-containing protein [Streptomyces actinomycinicus]
MNTVLEAGTHPLHGRATEVQALRQAIHSAHRTGCLHVSIEGGPGTGKSRLLAEAASMAGAAGATVLKGLQEEPGGPCDRTLVVLLDDTHCSDPADVKALARLRLEAAGRPVVWCTSRRWGRPNSPLDIALGSLALPHRMFRLRPLDDRAAQRMARDILGAEPDEELARTVSAVSGHPKALRALLEGLMDEGRVDVGATARLNGACLPERFKGLVRLYLQSCSPSTTHLILVAAVLGTHLIFGELTEVLGLKASQLLPDIQEAVTAGLLSQDGDDVRFANPLFRRVVMDSMAASAQVAVREQADEYRARQFGAALDWSGRDAGADATVVPLRRPAAAPAPPPAAAEWAHLTEKQVVIARLTVQGLTNKEIAERLYLSPHTVNYHLRKIFQALSIRSRTDLVRLAHTAAAGGTGASGAAERRIGGHAQA